MVFRKPPSENSRVTVSFTRKSLQEMEASKFVTQELETSKDVKVIFSRINEGCQ